MSADYETIRGYEVNLPGGKPNWGARENLVIKNIVGKLPDLTKYLTGKEYHSHSILVDGSTDSATSPTGFSVVGSTAYAGTPGSSGATPTAGALLVAEKNGNAILNILSPNANESQLVLGHVSNSGWGVVKSDYANGVLRLERDSKGISLGAESLFIDNHNNNDNPINGVNGVPISVNLVSAQTPTGAAGAFLVLIHIDFSGGGSSGGVTELFLGTSNFTGGGSLLSLGARNDAAGAPAGYGVYSFTSAVSSHIAFNWTANNIGQTARVFARVIMFNFIT